MESKPTHNIVNCGNSVQYNDGLHPLQIKELPKEKTVVFIKIFL